MYTVKTLILTLFITAKFFTTSVVLAQMYQFSLNLSSLQQKLGLTLNYLETNAVVVKRVDCIYAPLYVQMDSSLFNMFNTINLRWSIVNIEGSQVIISKYFFFH